MKFYNGDLNYEGGLIKSMMLTPSNRKGKGTGPKIKALIVSAPRLYSRTTHTTIGNNPIKVIMEKRLIFNQEKAKIR